MSVISGRGVRCTVKEANPNPEPITLEKANMVAPPDVYKPRIIPQNKVVIPIDPTKIKYETNPKVIQQKASVILNPEMAEPPVITKPYILKDRND